MEQAKNIQLLWVGAFLLTSITFFDLWKTEMTPAFSRLNPSLHEQGSIIDCDHFE